MSGDVAFCIFVLSKSNTRGEAMRKKITSISVIGRFFTFLLFLPYQGHAQGTAAQNHDSLFQSPRATIHTHLWYLQPEHYNPEIASYTLDHPQPGSAKAKKLAIQLKQIYDGMGLLVQIETIPEDPNFLDSTTQSHRYTPFPKELPEVYLVKKGSRWLYSATTVAAIPSLHRKIYPLGISQFLDIMPAFGMKKFLGLAIWQYVLTLLILFLAYAFYRLAVWIFTNVLLRIIRKIRKTESDIAIQWLQKVARPLSFLLVLIILRMLLPLLQYPVELARILIIGFKIAIPLTITLIAYHIVGLVAEIASKVAEKTDTTMDDQIIPFARKIVKVLILIVGVLFILDNLGYDITTLIAGLSIGGLAVALAAQDTIKNFFGSLVIFTDRPFRQGDYINYQGIEGTIEDIGLRSTRIRTPYNSVVTIPNAQLADAAIDNLGMRIYRRLRMLVGVTYDTPPEKIALFVEALRKLVELHPVTRKDLYHIYFFEMGASSLNILVNIFFEVPDFPAELEARHQFLLGVLYLGQSLGIEFAFPTQTIHVETFPGQPLPKKEEGSTPQLQKEIDAIVDSVRAKIFPPDALPDADQGSD